MVQAAGVLCVHVHVPSEKFSLVQTFMELLVNPLDEILCLLHVETTPTLIYSLIQYSCMYGH